MKQALTSFGQTFCFFREAKGYTIADVADETVSKGMISKFENGHSDISTQRFIHLLNKIGVQVHEFFLYRKYQAKIAKTDFVNQISLLINKADSAGLAALNREMQQRYLETGTFRDQANWIMGEVQYANLVHQPLNPKVDFKVIEDYLFKTEIWGNNELVYYASIMVAMPIDRVVEYSKSVFAKIKFYRLDLQVYETAINIMLNTVGLLIDHHRLKDAQQALNQIKLQKIAEVYLFDNVMILAYQGFIDYLSGHKEVGLKAINQAILAFEAAGAKGFAREMREQAIAWQVDLKRL